MSKKEVKQKFKEKIERMERKVIFEEIMALKSFLTMYLTPQSKCHHISNNLYCIDCVSCPQYDTMRNQ